MNKALRVLYLAAKKHKINHQCGGVPYDNADILIKVVSDFKPLKIMEVGTGLGYTSACMALTYPSATIYTIDQDDTHLQLAKENWQTLGINSKIITLHGKVEGILPTLNDSFDLIFFDGYAPQIKLLPHFERLLNKVGILVTANMFLRDPRGGRYLKALKNTEKWQTDVFADTAYSLKLV